MDCGKDKRIHQLNKLCDETLERNDIFPITVTDAVFDKQTGNSLKSILLQNNNIFLPFKGSAAATRISLPVALRRKGIIISYVNMDNEAITEKLINDDDISDAFIALDANWEKITLESVVNYPDEEDITAINDKLKFKDKEYVSDSYLGLGRKYLRLNIVDTKNVLTQDMINEENTIYHIQYDYNLNGGIINLPNNSLLEFDGGSIDGGTINGNNTKIIGTLTQIFKNNITITGTWDIIESYPEWFGAKGDGVTNDTVALQTCINYFNVIKLSNRTYITDMLNIPSFKNIIGEGKNSIIKANPSMALTNNYLIRTKDGGSGIRISNLKIICGNTSNEDDYKIGGIGLISTANANNDQWDTRNIIENVEILNCYAASIYIGTYQRENKIQNCFISNTTNNGINCQGTDNMINGCTIAGTHLSGIMLQGNNRLSNTKLFGCSKSEITKNLYALDIFGSKCNVSNVELQQNYYGGVIVRGNSNYVQVTNDNNGSGNTAGTTTGASIVGSYNTIIVTSYNFSFHDDAYERYFVSTNYNTVGNNIIVNGTPLKNNKMSALSPWSVDNICNNINWNGYNLTQNREVSFDKLVVPNKYRTNGNGSFHTNETGLSFKITSVTAIGNDVLSYAIPIYNSNKIDPDGCFSIKARFHKNGDADDAIYPVIRINTYYKNSAGTTITRTDQNTIINLLDNKDSLDVYALTSYHHLSDKPVSISSVSVELIVRSTKILSDVSIDAYFDDIKIGATTSGDTVKFINSNVDGTNGSKVVIANEMSDFTLENVIYKIISDIDLGTSELVIPANCILDFQGGSISNGTITGNNTKIIANKNEIFENVIINGTWKCSDIYDDWFTKEDDSFVNLQNICNLSSDDFLSNIYINQNHNITIPSNAASIKPNSNTIINIKGNVTVNPNEFTNYYVFRLIDKKNVTFTGGGSLIGDIETHTGTTGEWGHGLFIQGSNNITVRNLNLTKFWGDGIEVDKSTTNDYTSELYIRDLIISNNRRQGISLLAVKNVFIDNCVIHGIGSIKGTNPKGAIDIEPEGEDVAENIFISNCIEYSNGLGITAHNTIKNIIVNNCTCLSSQGIWHTGDITFKNCLFGRYFNLEGDIIRFIDCDMPVTNVISSNYVEIEGCTFRSKASFDTVTDKSALLVFNYSDTAITKNCKVRVRNSSFDNTKEGTSSIPLVRKALAKNMGDKDVVFEKCSFKNTLSYLYGAIQYGDYYNCLFEVPTLALQLYADKIIKLVGNTIVKNDTATDKAIITIESITKNFDTNSMVLALMGNSFQYSGVSIIDIIPTNVNDKIVSFINNLFSTRYISEESTLYINLKNKFDTFYYSNSRMDYNRYIGTTGTEGTPSVNNAGQMFYDSTLKKMKLWNGIAWTNLDGTALS